MHLHCQETPLKDFPHGIVSLYRFNAQERNITLELKEDESLSSDKGKLKVWIDRINFDKVISNLLSNAMKYTFDGGEITVIIGKGEKNATIRVEDTGIGLKEEKTDRLFERFYQGNNSSGLHIEGTGIGLNLCKAFVEMHGGKIKAYNRTDGIKGSCFEVSIPLGNSHLQPGEILEEEHKKEQEITKKKVQANRNFNILIVDDDSEIAQYIKTELSDWYRFERACNGKEGLKMLLTGKYDLVISDVMMPEMSGKELCYKIKNSIELSYIPVILLTAQVSEQYTIEGYMFGADDYITKPFNVKILIARCSNLIKTRQQMLERLKQPIANKQEAPDTININDRQLLEKATQIIKENFENPEFDMNLLASELGMGRSKLYTKLKEITGLTPNEFTLKLKLEEAMHLLNNAPHLNVTEISYQLGFSSARYFSKCFKTFYGIAPLNVRKNANPPAKEE